MKEVLKQLQKEIETQQERVNYYENARGNCARGSARWRELDEIAGRYKACILGIEIAIAAIERAQVTK